MSIEISQVFDGLVSQQLPALKGLLIKAKAFTSANEYDDSALLQTRLSEDMHPLKWQIQTACELILRGRDRLTNHQPTNLNFEQDDFDALIQRVASIETELSTLDKNTLNLSADREFELPVGPDMVLTLSGRDYVLKFMLPNVYFHLTTTYAILRMKGVEIGKRDFMGPIL